MRKAFTLIELLVVISIIALLIAILLPALSSARESAIRSECLGKATQIAVASTAYATDLDGLFIPMTGVDDTLPLDGAWSPTGMDRDTRDSFRDYGFEFDLWTCPGWQTYKAIVQPGNGQLQTTYFYFGGVTAWRGGSGSPWSGLVEARGPVDLEDATSEIALASDAMCQSNVGTWVPRNDYNYAYWSEMPVHGRMEDLSPKGGNHIFADGSGGWIAGDKLMPLQFFGSARQAWWYQKDVGELETNGTLIPD